MNEITTRILKLLLLVFAVVLAVTIFYHLLYQSYETETAIYYEATDFSAFQGVYVRDETVQHYNGTGAVRYCVDDGAKLGVGSVIAEIYSSEDQIDLRRRIAAKEDELAMLRKIQNPGTTEHAQPAALSDLIEEQYKAFVRLRDEGNFSALTDSRQQLTLLMSTYEKITTPELDFTDRIALLEQEIDRLHAQEQSPEQICRAQKSAYFISYVDGYEDKFTTAGLNKLTAADISAVTNDTISADTHTTQAIGKLVDGYAWYIVGIFDNTKLHLAVDDYVTVRLESLPRSFKVRVQELTATGSVNQTQAVLRCDRMTHDVVQHRTERVEIIRDTQEGIRVPATAIRFKNMEVTEVQPDGTEITKTENCMGCYVQVGEAPEFRRLQVVYQDDSYVLSAMDAGPGFVALYDDIIVRGVDAEGN